MRHFACVRRERPPARSAQRCESGGKAPKATQGGVSFPAKFNEACQVVVLVTKLVVHHDQALGVVRQG